MSTPSRIRSWRLLLAAAGAGLGGAAAMGARLGVALDSRSPLLWGGVAASGLLAIAALVLALFPDMVLARVDDGWRRLVRRLSESSPPRTSVPARWLAFLALLAYFACAVVERSRPDDVSDDDQGAFLTTAGEIRDAGGAAVLLRRLFAGEFAEANRHPLYLAFLSLRPMESFGRTLSLAFGAAALVASWWCVRRTWGDVTAGLFAALLATNGAFVRFSSLVVCETLLLLVSACAWFVAARLIQSPPVATGGSNAPTGTTVLRLYPCALGALLGLVWLTKGTGLPLLAATIAWLFWEGLHHPAGRWSWLGTNLLAMLAAFLVVSSPLLVRNAVRYGSPFYNVNTTLLFVDEFTDPQTLAEQGTTAELARRYWESHSLLDAARREAEGCVWEAYLFVRSLGPVPFDDGRAPCGAVIAVLAVLGLVVDPRAPRRLTVAWTLTLWPVFAWYVPIAAGERFVLPLLVPWLAAAAEGAARIAVTRGGEARGVGRLLVAGAVWCILWSGLHITGV